MLLTSVSESVAFFLGALTPMPAVRLFSLYAAMSVLIDFLLQITVFISFITLDHKRTMNNRADVFCCLQLFTAKKTDRYRWNWFRGQPSIEETNPVETSLTSESDTAVEPLADNDGCLFRVFKRYYAPFIMHDCVRPLVIFLFFTWLAASIVLIPHVKVGLEQNITMSKDSYMLDYFSALKQYFAVGPPVYFVIKPGKSNALSHRLVLTSHLS